MSNKISPEEPPKEESNLNRAGDVALTVALAVGIAVIAVLVVAAVITIELICGACMLAPVYGPYVAIALYPTSPDCYYALLVSIGASPLILILFLLLKGNLYYWMKPTEDCFWPHRLFGRIYIETLVLGLNVLPFTLIALSFYLNLRGLLFFIPVGPLMLCFIICQSPTMEYVHSEIRILNDYVNNMVSACPVITFTIMKYEKEFVNTDVGHDYELKEVVTSKVHFDTWNDRSDTHEMIDEYKPIGRVICTKKWICADLQTELAIKSQKKQFKQKHEAPHTKFLQDLEIEGYEERFICGDRRGQWRTRTCFLLSSLFFCYYIYVACFYAFTPRIYVNIVKSIKKH